MNKEQCFFVSKYKCENKTGPLKDAGPVRIKHFIKHIKIYGDRFVEILEEKIIENPELTVKCHRNCASTYTASLQVERHKRKNPDIDSCPSLLKTRTQSTVFSFKEQCLFCGEICMLEKKPKHPKRLRLAYL